MKNMIGFYWTGINTYGQKINGQVNTHKKQDAIQQLINDGITILSIKKKDAFFFVSQKKISEKALFDFMQQLLLLLQAGIPLSDAFTLIIKSLQNAGLKLVLALIQEKIVAGSSLADALGYFPHYFNRYFCKMIEAGEHSGNLVFVLSQLIDHQEKINVLKSKMSKALFYPACVLSVAVFISIGLLVVVIPQFSAIYANFGAQLPLLTRKVIALSYQLQSHGVFYLFGTTLLCFFIKRFFSVNRSWNHIVFYLPFFNALIITKQVAGWSQIITMALSSGIPLIDALQMANETVSHFLLQGQLIKTKEAVIAGQSLHMALAQCSYFPERAKYLIAIGENADALDKMTGKIAVLYQQQLFDGLERLSKLMEPVIMIVVAGLVSGLIIAMYLPIFRMGSVI